MPTGLGGPVVDCRERGEGAMAEPAWEELSELQKLERLRETVTALAKAHNEFLDLYARKSAENERAMEKLEARLNALEKTEPGSQGY